MRRGSANAEAEALVARLLPNPEERRRYQDAPRRLTALRPVSACLLAGCANPTHRRHEVAWALHADPRFMREAGRGLERFVLRPEYHHAALLQRQRPPRAEGGGGEAEA